MELRRLIENALWKFAIDGKTISEFLNKKEFQAEWGLLNEQGDQIRQMWFEFSIRGKGTFMIKQDGAVLQQTTTGWQSDTTLQINTIAELLSQADQITLVDPPLPRYLTDKNLRGYKLTKFKIVADSANIDTETYEDISDFDLIDTIREDLGILDDLTGIDLIKEIRIKMQWMAPHLEGVAAYATYELNGKKGYILSKSGKQMLPGSILINEKIKHFAYIFEAIKVSYLRFNDAERKIIEMLIDNFFLFYRAEGDINLFIEQKPCESCENILYLFDMMFPDVEINWDWEYETFDDRMEDPFYK